MPLTPEDVQKKQFSTVRFKEGYDEEEVDAFLDEVEAELRRLLAEHESIGRGGPAAPPPPRPHRPRVPPPRGPGAVPPRRLLPRSPAMPSCGPCSSRSAPPTRRSRRRARRRSRS